MARRLSIAIDAVGLRRASGGAVVLVDLLDALLRCESVERVVVFALAGFRRQFALPSDARLTLVERQNAGSRIELLRWVSTGLDRSCARHSVDGMISLNALGWSRVPTVVLFQQQLMFAPEALRLMPASFRARLWGMRQLAERMCRRAALVIAQAPHVAASLTAQFGVEPSRLRVIMPDVRWPEARQSSPGPWLQRSTLLYVGSDRRYKSLETVLTAFEALRSSDSALQLALTLPEYPPAARRAGVRCLGTLPRHQVKAVLEQASALVMPSLAETLGLPLLEALDVGCPVIAADLPYARDVCGDAALYFEPRSAVGCAARCAALLSDPSLAAQLSAAGRARMASLRAAAPSRALADAICQAIASAPAPISG